MKRTELVIHKSNHYKTFNARSSVKIMYSMTLYSSYVAARHGGKLGPITRLFTVKGNEDEWKQECRPH